MTFIKSPTIMQLMNDGANIIGRVSTGTRIALARQIAGRQNELYELEGANWPGAALQRKELERQIAELRGRGLAQARVALAMATTDADHAAAVRRVMHLEARS